ncbi:MAG: helicase-associated domain-containing protein [Rhodoluna sp.]
MSEVLEVAKALAKSSDSELERVIGIRLMPSANFKDFFDFASALVKPQNLKGAVAGLTRNQIIAFQNLLNGKPTAKDKTSLEVLAKLFLVHKTDHGYVPLESVKEIFKQLVTKDLLAKLNQPDEKKLANPISPEQIDPLAGVGAFETIQALTELIIDLEQRYVPEVGRGAVGLVELKRLASFLGKDVDYARRLYALAQIAGLVVLDQERWRVGQNYASWLESEPSARWSQLASNWLRLLGPESAKELADEADLTAAITKTFPIANVGIASHMSNLVLLAELIGLTANHQASSWFKPVMKGEITKATATIAKWLPQMQNKLIVQADLTLISTGPLDTAKELLIRRFADIERIGVASSYRMNALSITYGMETGLSEAEIRKTLKNLSGKDLPQPVDYVLRESAQRFGRLTIRTNNKGSLVESKDALLITTILNDSELAALGFVQLDPNTLQTRFEQEIVYYQLRENKFAAVALDESGKVVTSWFSSERVNYLAKCHSLKEDIQRWREHDKRLGENPMGEDIVRSLELAIRNKGTVKVVVDDKKTKREFTLAPTGLANGRLRAKDKKADCERVLPLASITSVVIG